MFVSVKLFIMLSKGVILGNVLIGMKCNRTNDLSIFFICDMIIISSLKISVVGSKNQTHCEHIYSFYVFLSK